MLVDELGWQDTDPPVDDETIRSVQDRLGVKLPKDFVVAAKHYHGGHPLVNCFTFFDESHRETKSSLGGLLSLDSNSDIESILDINETPPEGLPRGLVIFGLEGGGGYLCFDYRNTRSDPEVVFWISDYHSADIVFPLAKTFTDFVWMLEEPDD
jgi:hypothetical protein